MRFLLVSIISNPGTYFLFMSSLIFILLEGWMGCFWVSECLQNADVQVCCELSKITIGQQMVHWPLHMWLRFLAEASRRSLIYCLLYSVAQCIRVIGAGTDSSCCMTQRMRLFVRWCLTAQQRKSEQWLFNLCLLFTSSDTNVPIQIRVKH